MNALGADQLRLLALIGELGSLAAAADELRLTPAAVTQRLARMESLSATELVVRGPRGAELTSVGAMLAVRGARIHAETSRADDDLRAWRERSSHRLRIGAFQAAARHLLPPALTAMRHTDSTTDISVVDIQSQHGMRMVADGELDLGVIAVWDEPPDVAAAVRVTRLLADPMVLVVPDDHRLARTTRPVGLEQLADDSWVLIRAGHEARAQFDHAAHLAGFEPRVRFETESYDVAQSLVGTGYGVALVSELALTQTAGVAVLRLRDSGLSRAIYAVRSADVRSEAATEGFLSLLVDVADDLAGSLTSLDRPQR